MQHIFGAVLSDEKLLRAGESCLFSGRHHNPEKPGNPGEFIAAVGRGIENKIGLLRQIMEDVRIRALKRLVVDP